jgi:hypothetical protein
MKTDTNSQMLKKPDPALKELDVFAGTWHTTGEVSATASTPAVKIDAIDKYPGGFFLVHHADGRIGDDDIRSTEIMGYNPAQKNFFSFFFDSTGGYGQEDIRLDGNTWIWRGSNIMGVKEHRCFGVVSEDKKTIRARHEKSADGVQWELWMNVTLEKEK